MSNRNQEYLLGTKHLKLTALTILVSLLSIAICTSIGYLLDQQFSISPTLTIIFFLLSYPLSQVVNIKIIKKFILK